MTVDSLINDFAVRSFRDVADADYIAARMACRAALTTQYLWAGQQAVEKYLKCILLLNRIPAKDVRHDLGKALGKIEEAGKVTLDLTKGTREFIERLDEYGPYRYFEVSNVGFGAELVRWTGPYGNCAATALSPGNLGRRSSGMDIQRRARAYPRRGSGEDHGRRKKPGAGAAAWQNGFFGKKARRTVRLRKWFLAHNAPLYLNPQILEEVLKYVFLPKELAEGYRRHTRQ